jgi:hypothetical protein
MLVCGAQQGTSACLRKPSDVSAGPSVSSHSVRIQPLGTIAQVPFGSFALFCPRGLTDGIGLVKGVSMSISKIAWIS